jgi:hypothetical protein
LYQIQAWGEVTLDVKRGNQTALITLKKVAYILGYVANIFSLSCCKKIYFNLKTNTLFREHDESLFMDLDRIGGHWFLKAQDALQPFQAMAAASTQAKAPQIVTAMKAHQLLGHPSYQAIEQLKDSTTGLKVGTNGKGGHTTVASSPAQKQIQQLPSPTPDPRGTPDPCGTSDSHDSPDPAEQQLLEESSAASQHMTPGGWNSDKNPDEDLGTITSALYVLVRQQNNAPQQRDPDLSQDNIVTGKRRRQAHFIEASPSTKYFAFAAIIQQFSKVIALALELIVKHDPTRLYRDNLSPPPSPWKELQYPWLVDLAAQYAHISYSLGISSLCEVSI